MTNRRILLIDDNPAIHEDFRKILGTALHGEAELLRSAQLLFGKSKSTRPVFQIDSAFQGQEGVALIARAQELQQPYAMAFIDMRMPPGWDGLETVVNIWQQDPELQIVICTAYSDYSWEQIRDKLGQTERLVILKKPFDRDEVLQLADTLTEKWQRARYTNDRIKMLQQALTARTRDIQAISDQLEKVTQHDSKMNAEARRHRSLERALRRALQANEFIVHYQPLVDIASQRAVSLEALVRWRHPKLGMISPAQFIPVAESSGLILPLGEFVLRTVCEQVMRWQRENIPVIPVAVNVSAVQFQRQPMRELVGRILAETGMPARWLALELTEGTLMQDPQHHIAVLQDLRSDGIRIQIDDFGTGYSSLSYLRQLPIDTLKIDGSFIKQIDTNPSDEAIVSAILAMARSLDLRVVAEGVETTAQLQVLGKHGCEIAQGFFFCRPLPADGSRELLLDLARRPAFTDTLRLQLAKQQDAAVLPKLRGQRQ